MGPRLGVVGRSITSASVAATVRSIAPGSARRTRRAVAARATCRRFQRRCLQLTRARMARDVPGRPAGSGPQRNRWCPARAAPRSCPLAYVRRTAPRLTAGTGNLRLQRVGERRDAARSRHSCQLVQVRLVGCEDCFLLQRCSYRAHFQAAQLAPGSVIEDEAHSPAPGVNSQTTTSATGASIPDAAAHSSPPWHGRRWLCQVGVMTEPPLRLACVASHFNVVASGVHREVAG